MKMNHKKLVTILWLVLLALTLFSAFMAEQAKADLPSTVIIAVVLAVKGRIIVDYFMELKNAHVVLRALMRAYFYVIPCLILGVYFFPEKIASWTKL
jgi:hypothetical protein